MVKFKKIRIIILTIIFFSGCALQLPPEGGAIDLIPPKILSTFPESGTVNYNKNYFEIEFSEYVDKRSFREALFISPTIEGDMIIDWSGKSVEVSFTQGFKENTTYIITIGTDLIDLNNKNRMANAYNLSFSTGDKIDDKVISGKVYDKQVDGTMIFAYSYKSDTSNYLLTKADYISQCGKDGQFSIQGLPKGNFRVFAVKDQFRDLIFQAEQDLIGIPYLDIVLSEKDSAYSELNFYLSKIDTIPPHILEARMIDEKHILLKFSEELDLNSLNKESFKVIDTIQQVVSNVSYFFNTLTKLNELIIIPENIPMNSLDLFLEVREFRDVNNNLQKNEKVSFIYTDKKDTNALKILKTEPSDLKIDFLKPSIRIYFDDAFQKEKIDSAFEFMDATNNKVNFNLDYINDAAIKISPQQKLKPDSKYQLKINMKLIPDASDNFSDTTIVLNFSTRTEFEFSGLSGKVNTDKKNLVLVLESESDSEQKEFIKLNDKKSFDFNRILPGKYKLWAFEDLNNNDKYDYGSLFPFEFAERFYYYPEVIEIKARWSVADLIININ